MLATRGRSVDSVSRTPCRAGAASSIRTRRAVQLRDLPSADVPRQDARARRRPRGGRRAPRRRHRRGRGWREPRRPSSCATRPRGEEGVHALRCDGLVHAEHVAESLGRSNPAGCRVRSRRATRWSWMPWRWWKTARPAPDEEVAEEPEEGGRCRCPGRSWGRRCVFSPAAAARVATSSGTGVDMPPFYAAREL